jgi:hypothetical protein
VGVPRATGHLNPQLSASRSTTLQCLVRIPQHSSLPRQILIPTIARPVPGSQPLGQRYGSIPGASGVPSQWTPNSGRPLQPTSLMAPEQPVAAVIAISPT